MPLFETGKVELPNGEWVEIRELSVGQLKAADKVGTEDAVSLMNLLPEKMVDKWTEKQRELSMERVIRYEGYDPETLLRFGVTSWSFEEPCDDENKANLGDKKGEIVARAIFELSVISAGEVVDSPLRLVGDESQDASQVPTPSIESEEPSASPSTSPRPIDSLRS